METATSPIVLTANTDPLSVDLTTLDASRPLIGNGNYPLRVVKSEIKPTASGDAKMIHLELETTAPVTGIKGEDIAPGARVFDNIMLSATGKATPDMVLRGPRSVTAYVQAAGISNANGPVQPNTADNWHKQAEGKIILCSVQYEGESVGKDGKRYSAKNVISAYIKQ